jgi:hypothetical protein
MSFSYSALGSSIDSALGEAKERDLAARLKELEDSSTESAPIKDTAAKSEGGKDMAEEEEAYRRCKELREEYNVEPGVSWGDLPTDLRSDWVTYECESLDSRFS